VPWKITALSSEEDPPAIRLNMFHTVRQPTPPCRPGTSTTPCSGRLAAPRRTVICSTRHRPSGSASAPDQCQPSGWPRLSGPPVSAVRPVGRTAAATRPAAGRLRTEWSASAAPAPASLRLAGAARRRRGGSLGQMASASSVKAVDRRSWGGARRWRVRSVRGGGSARTRGGGDPCKVVPHRVRGSLRSDPTSGAA
jgi:hypothetical protein